MDATTQPAPISQSHVLTSMYDITRRLFQFLPMRSVEICRTVCQSWAQMANLLKESRLFIESFSYPNPVSACSDSMDPIPIEDFDRYLSLYINDKLWSLPHFALIFATNEFDAHGLSVPSDSTVSKSAKRSSTDTSVRRRSRVSLFSSLLPYLNKSCKALMVVTSGIISSNDQFQSNEIESGYGLSFLLLPKFSPNICGVYPFQLSSRRRIKDMSRLEIHQTFGNVPEHLPIRSVMFFFRIRKSQIDDCLKKLSEYYSSEVAIIGAFVDELRLNYGEQLLFNTCGLALTGDPEHLHIRQVVLDDTIRTREQIREKLKLLQSTHYEQSTMSFAIQITCVARGSHFFHQEKDVECSEFRRLFPRTPLIGGFGNGELGHDFPTETDVLMSNHDDLFRSYSTVFSLISIHM